jgi:hypothetical protein
MDFYQSDSAIFSNSTTINHELFESALSDSLLAVNDLVSSIRLEGVYMGTVQYQVGFVMRWLLYGIQFYYNIPYMLEAFIYHIIDAVSIFGKPKFFVKGLRKPVPIVYPQGY